ncbi:hypothetical protein HWV62_33335 [Athelia sp. TMB]|nr:hypothetical protein HWV62_33335 [Athelia sp. TMB]
MADGNQYPMTMPTNFNPSLLQQHQIQQAQQAQQHQQQQAGMDNGNLGGITNPEQARMWQQIQQAQKDFRTQNGSDMTGARVTQQVASLIANQNLARMQAQQQMGQQQHQQQQQQFGLAAAQLAAGQQAPQHPGFHDQQQGQPQMPGNFPNMNAGQMQNFNRNAAMMQAFNQTNVFRQLELTGMAQQQQHQTPQAVPPNFAARIASQAAGMNGQAGPSQQPHIFPWATVSRYETGVPSTSGARGPPRRPPRDELRRSQRAREPGRWPESGDGIVPCATTPASGAVAGPAGVDGAAWHGAGAGASDGPRCTPVARPLATSESAAESTDSRSSAVAAELHGRAAVSRVNEGTETTTQPSGAIHAAAAGATAGATAACSNAATSSVAAAKREAEPNPAATARQVRDDLRALGASEEGHVPGWWVPAAHGNLPGNPPQTNPAAAPTSSAAQQINTVMMYAHVPAAELHARGVPDNVIRFVEANRANLQRSVQQQISFRGVVQNGSSSAEQAQFWQTQAGMQHQARGPQQAYAPQHLSATMKQSQKQPKDQQCQFCLKLYAKNGIASHVKSCAAHHADVIRDTAFRMDRPSVRAVDNQSRPSDGHQDSLQPQYTEPVDSAEFGDFTGSPDEPTTPLPEPLETRKDDIRTEYHPKTGCAACVAHFDEYGREETTSSTRSIDETPWAPFFRTRLDFELAEVMQEAALNREQISRLISLIHQARLHKDGEGFTITSYSDLKSSWDNAAAVLSVPFVPRTVSVPYKQGERSYELHFRPLFRWALSLVDHPRLAHEFRWDAERISKFDGHKWQRVYHEPWTAEDWWSTQSALPENASPLCIILYADKTKLSSFGTEKGYPIIARIANLPVHIRNSNGLGGGQVVGWLPIVSEDAGETGKTGFVNHKNAVWHESFREFMEDAAMHSSTGLHHVCGDDVERWLFPIVLILSADYEEQCIMALIRGLRGKCPCPKCLVLAEHLSDLSGNPTPRSAADTMEVLDRVSKMTKEEAEKILKPLGLRNVQNAFFKMIHSDVNRALSFDRLHTDQGGLFGDHQWPQIKLHIQSLGRKAIQAVDEYIDSVPRWRDLNHFKSIMQLTVFATQSVLTEDACPVGYLLLRCLRAFLVFDMYAALEVHTEDTITLGREAVTNFGILMKEYIKATDGMEKFGDKSWDFIKAHLPKHIFDDVVGKGATRNYNTKPNEKLHGPLKNAYRDRTNFKNVAQQILKVEEHSTASRLIRADITELNQHHENSSPAVDMPDDVDAFLGFSLGSKQKPCTIQKLVETAHNDNAFSEFRVRLQKFLSAALGITVKLQDNSIISEYRFLKVDFAHAVDWRTAEDYLRCNPTFHGHPRYDSVIYPTDKGLVFAQLILLFNCTVADATHSIALVQPYDEHIPASERPKKDRDLGLLRYRARRRKFSEFISVSSIIRGALLVQDPDVPDERFVVDVVDTDMFLRLQHLHRITPDSS